VTVLKLDPLFYFVPCKDDEEFVINVDEDDEVEEMDVENGEQNFDNDSENGGENFDNGSENGGENFDNGSENGGENFDNGSENGGENFDNDSENGEEGERDQAAMNEILALTPEELAALDRDQIKEYLAVIDPLFDMKTRKQTPTLLKALVEKIASMQSGSDDEKSTYF
jgi:hypothetical protein